MKSIRHYFTKLTILTNAHSNNEKEIVLIFL